MLINTSRMTYVLALLFLAVPAFADDVARPVEKKPNVDVAICLDTSNSMDGLIGSAKARLWDIVNELARARPIPTLRVALYSYGNTRYDQSAGWIRKELDLTTDLDKVSEKLFALTTSGGDEYHTRVARNALDQLQWSEDPRALKIIFVCGNEPLEQDREHPLKSVAAAATRKHIIINTIYCGSATDSEVPAWRDFAVLSEGTFTNIDQGRGTVAIATPYDKDLAELGTKLNSTYVFYGKEGAARKANQAVQDSNAESLSPATSAQRSVSKSSAVYRNADVCLVEKLMEDPTFDVNKIAEADLPDELRKLTPEARGKYLKDKVAERTALKKKIGELAKKREEHVQVERKKTASSGEKALDDAIRGAIRTQAKRKGINIPE